MVQLFADCPYWLYRAPEGPDFSWCWEWEVQLKHKEANGHGSWNLVLRLEPCSLESSRQDKSPAPRQPGSTPAARPALHTWQLSIDAKLQGLVLAPCRTQLLHQIVFNWEPGVPDKWGNEITVGKQQGPTSWALVGRQVLCRAYIVPSSLCTSTDSCESLRDITGLVAENSRAGRGFGNHPRLCSHC